MVRGGTACFPQFGEVYALVRLLERHILPGGASSGILRVLLARKKKQSGWLVEPAPDCAPWEYSLVYCRAAISRSV